eukprot:CAMPEP_0194042176 /NCGR_PEP_ID=MMETSP0009_2-20130614/13970_1 /TAXON_ID=210454 /ORGANISM="Grammatophora oceanica, Strain CCMP 410" /LENGTH=344 /DNA_ID=CAMNT_0038685925 /DNA_START=1096 /DNA_END=2130 /DNA_ORIENTATION=-
MNLNVAFSFFSAFLLVDTARAQTVLHDERRLRKTVAPTPSPTPAGVKLDQLQAFYEQTFFGGDPITCETYSMSEYDGNYETSFIVDGWASWGHHALQWKGYHHISENNGQGFYSPTQADTFNPPMSTIAYGFVDCVDKDDLNMIELASSQVYFDGTGSFVDPNGIWICLKEGDPFVGAVTAAMGMHYWGSPTYVNAHNCPNGICVVAAVVEKVTLCAQGTLPAHELCGWDDNVWDASVGSTDSCSAALILDSIEIGFFKGASNTDRFQPHNVITGAEWAMIYGDWSTKPIDQDLVMDPPVKKTEAELTNFHKHAAATAQNLQVVVEGRDGKLELVHASKAKPVE